MNVCVSVCVTGVGRDEQLDIDLPQLSSWSRASVSDGLADKSRVTAIRYTFPLSVKKMFDIITTGDLS